jgi:hypothetical protein
MLIICQPASTQQMGSNVDSISSGQTFETSQGNYLEIYVGKPKATQMVETTCKCNV